MVARLRVGDEQALAAVFDQYSSLVHRIAVRLVGSADAADVVQEVFVSLWDHPDAFDPDRGTLRTFLAVVARRRGIDQLRRTGRRQARQARAAQDGPRVAPSVDEAAFALMAAQRVHDALGRLPAEQRRAIELAYLDGLTSQAVAAAMDSPEGTAKSRLRLGLRRLARELADWGGVVGEPGWT